MSVSDTYPEFDITLECLARLRAEPLPTSLSLLAIDLHLPGQNSVREILFTLAGDGYGIVRWTHEGERVAAIRKADYPRAKRAAEEYLDRRAAAEAAMA